MTRYTYCGCLCFLSVVHSGIRGPARNGKALLSLLDSRSFDAAGADNDPHGTWLYATGFSDPDYVTTVSAHRPFLNPGLALISHPVTSTTGLRGGTTPGSTVPGGFQHWAAAAMLNSVLMAPGSPGKPLLGQPEAAEADLGSSSSSSAVALESVTLPWSLPAGSAPVQQFRLFVAADPLFSEVLRQPASDAFQPPDISGSARSVDVMLGSRLLGRDIYVLLMACTDRACRASCVQHFTLTESLPLPPSR